MIVNVGQDSKDDGEIVFSTSSLSVVKDWIKGGGDDGGDGEDAEGSDEAGLDHRQNSTRTVESKSGNKVARQGKNRRLGVGAQNEETTADQVPEEIAKLQKSLGGKRRRSDEAEEISTEKEDFSESEEESRTSSFKRVKAEAKSAVDLVLSSQGSMGMETNDAKKKRKKNKRKSKKANKEDGPTLSSEVSKQSMVVKSPPVAAKQESICSKSSQQSGRSDIQAMNTHQKHTIASPTAENSAGRDVEGGQAKRKRKRKKTRSKQKNIRKDRRALTERPSYLQPGSQDFRGHPITPETKVRLQQQREDLKKEAQKTQGHLGGSIGKRKPQMSSDKKKLKNRIKKIRKNMKKSEDGNAVTLDTGLILVDDGKR